MNHYRAGEHHGLCLVMIALNKSCNLKKRHKDFVPFFT